MKEGNVMSPSRLSIIIPLTIVVASVLSGCAAPAEVTLNGEPVDTYQEPQPTNTDPKKGTVIVSDGYYDKVLGNDTPYIAKICDASTLIYQDINGQLYFFQNDPQCVG
jgi:hypothetical protein